MEVKIELINELKEYLIAIQKKEIEIEKNSDEIIKTANSIKILAVQILIENASLNLNDISLGEIGKQFNVLSEQSKKNAYEDIEDAKSICKTIIETIKLCNSSNMNQGSYNQILVNLAKIRDFEKLVKTNDEKIQSTAQMIHILSVNTEILASHLGNSGKALMVVSEEIDLVLKQINALVSKSKKDTDEIDLIMSKIIEIYHQLTGQTFESNSESKILNKQNNK